MSHVVIVIPVYNEADVIIDVISEVRQHCPYDIVVVDDGSHDGTFQRTLQENVLAVRHKVNRGKGAAVKTGIMVANMLEADIIITMDGDGQHAPADLFPLIQPIVDKQCDVVLGSRMLDHKGMPVVKVIANWVGNLITWLFYGILVSDSQSGLRAYSRYAALIIDTKADKYEYDSKVIREIKNNRLRFTEVPIQVRYTEYSMGKQQKQGFVNGIKTLVRMVWNMLV